MSKCGVNHGAEATGVCVLHALPGIQPFQQLHQPLLKPGSLSRCQARQVEACAGQSKECNGRLLPVERVGLAMQPDASRASLPTWQLPEAGLSSTWYELNLSCYRHEPSNSFVMVGSHHQHACMIAASHILHEHAPGPLGNKICSH